MIIRATSDLHLTTDNAEYVFAALSQLEADARAHGGMTLILGDVFDQPQRVHMPTYNRLCRMLQRWPGAGVKLIPGNHDQYERPYGHCLLPLAGDSCSVVSLPAPSAYGLLVPYVDDFKDTISSLTPMVGAPNIIWAHEGFRGAYQNAMRRDESGSLLGEMPKGMLIVTGHYHLPQVMGNVIYTGSPFEHSFSEEGQEKGWIRFDLDESPHPERIAFEDTGAPKHITIHWDPSKPLPKIERNPRNKYRVKTLATRSEVKAHMGDLAEAGLQGVPVMAKRTERYQRGVVEHGAGPHEAVQSYIQAVHGGDPSLPSPGEMIEWAEEYEILTVA